MRNRVLVLLLGMCLAAPAAAAEASSLTTLFFSNNNGINGGAVYFDLTIGTSDLLITGFDTNTVAMTGFTASFYTYPTTRVGNETDGGGWTLVATGTGTGQGIDVPSFITLNSSFLLSANTSYGFAIVVNEVRHDYTNGTGANQVYSNADLTLTAGSASSVPFTGEIFTPRVWNGTIYYELQSRAVPEPATLLLLGTGLGAVAARRRLRRRA